MIHLTGLMQPSSSHTYLYEFVDTQSLVQLSQLALIGAAEEGDELLQQSFLVVLAFGGGRRAEHLVQRAGNALPAHTNTARRYYQLRVGLKGIRRNHGKENHTEI